MLCQVQQDLLGHDVFFQRARAVTESRTALARRVVRGERRVLPVFLLRIAIGKTSHYLFRDRRMLQGLLWCASPSQHIAEVCVRNGKLALPLEVVSVLARQL